MPLRQAFETLMSSSFSRMVDPDPFEELLQRREQHDLLNILPDATMVAQDVPEGHSPFDFLRESVERSIEATGTLFSGENPLDEGIRDLAAARVDSERNPLHDLPGAGLARDAADFSESPASMGMVFAPGIPGGPIFKNADEVWTGLNKMPTEKLVDVWHGAENSMANISLMGPGRQIGPGTPSQLPPVYSHSGSPISHRGAMETRVISDNASVVLMNRARHGDPQARRFVEDMFGEPGMSAEDIRRLFVAEETRIVDQNILDDALLELLDMRVP